MERRNAMRLLRFPQLKSEKNVPFTRQHIRRLQKAGDFPRPVPLGANTAAYLEEEIDAWVTSRVAKRDAQQQRQEAPAAAELAQKPARVVGVGKAKQAPPRSKPPPRPRSNAKSNVLENPR
jgi:prophage regulatory protein